ncbi:MAG: hypothetical protein J2P28_08730 [Actinobacteria bacterium]|nr:hypothetical protein [Actinomycetota bacterium]
MRVHSTRTRSRRGRWRRWVFRWFYRHGYLRRLRWPVRVFAWLVTAGLASIAGWQYALVGPLAFEVAFMITLVRDDGRVRGLPAPKAVDEADFAAAFAEARRQAALSRVPSPGGWEAPAGVRPAWNWTPPSGLEPRLDRVPIWARLWYGTPFIDRYAHAWMWHHGGWDVIPPDAWTDPSPV